MPDPVTLAILGAGGVVAVKAASDAKSKEHRKVAADKAADRRKSPPVLKAGAMVSASAISSIKASGGRTAGFHGPRKGSVRVSALTMGAARSQTLPPPHVVGDRRVYSTKRRAIDELERLAREEYDAAESEAKQRAADGINNAAGEKILDGTEDFDEASRKLGAYLGGAAAAAGCAATGIGAALAAGCAVIGAWVGEWAGGKLGEWLKSAWGDIEDWAEGAWDDISGGLEDFADDLKFW